MIDSKINDLKYGHINWGPYVMKTEMPKYIIKKMLVYPHLDLIYRL